MTQTFLKFDRDGFPSLVTTNTPDTNALPEDEARTVRAALARGDAVQKVGQGYQISPAASKPQLPKPTSAELDAIADRIADQEFQNDARSKAWGLVMADIVEKAFGISQQAARQEVRQRFRDYYRGLI